MANYKTMYVHLFQETTKAIEILQKAQQQCEEMYLSSEESIQSISVCDTQAK